MDRIDIDGIMYGYARLSQDSQDSRNEAAQLNASGCAITFLENASGATADRHHFKKMTTTLAAGCVLVMQIDGRLPRETTGLRVIARNMHCAGPGLRSKGEAVVDIDADFADGALCVQWFNVKYARRLIAGHTARGQAKTKAKGLQFGRKPKRISYRPREAQTRLAEGETPRSIARSYNFGQATISRVA